MSPERMQKLAVVAAKAIEATVGVMSVQFHREFQEHMSSGEPRGSRLAWRLRDPSRIIKAQKGERPGGFGPEDHQLADRIRAFAAEPKTIAPRDIIDIARALRMTMASELLYALVAGLRTVVTESAGMRLLRGISLGADMLPNGEAGRAAFAAALRDATITEAEGRAWLAEWRAKLTRGQSLAPEITAMLGEYDITII